MTGRLYDDAVVGAGIVGLAHAYQLGRRGRKVVVFERDIRASRASVRNFGMLWPVGQPPGDLLNLALDSIGHWKTILNESGIWHSKCGSLHVAHHDDEADVLREFVVDSKNYGYNCNLLEPEQVKDHSGIVNRAGLKLGLLSESEICVDPREVLASLPNWLASTYGVDFHFGCMVSACESNKVVTSKGDWGASRIWVCSGEDIHALFPEQFTDTGMIVCKLQMLRTEPLGEPSHVGPMLAGGLTLRHYESFQRCPSLVAVKQRVRETLPDYDQFGIHVMTCQNGRGELTIGDSHLYGDEIYPFDEVKIDRLILDYLQTFVALPPISIAQRWHGRYLKCPDNAYFVARVSATTTIVTGLGGAGMTLSFGLAEKCVKEVL